MAGCTTLVMVVTLLSLVSASPNSRKIDECTCFEEGNYYTTNIEDNCGSFLQRTAFLPEQKLACPPGLVFDVNVCVCDWAWRATCPKSCKETDTPVLKEECRQKGNIYGPVPGTDCNKFTQATDYLPPQEHMCPPGLKFNTADCVCDWPFKFECNI